MKTRLGAPFFIYVIAFHLAWIAWPYFVYPTLIAIGERTLTYAVLNIGLRLLVWVVPVLCYLRYLDRVEPLVYLKLTVNVRRGLVVAAMLSTANLLGSVARFGWPHPTLQPITWNSVLGTSILVGFIEEIPYRGFMLQKFAERFDFWLANLVTSLLFLAVHLPGWIALGTLSAASAATVFTIGIVLAISFRYSGSLWAAIAAHSANDFLSFVVFHV